MEKKNNPLDLIITDGGRSKYFTADKVGDCVTRAIAIASGRDYKEVYDELFKIAKKSPRNGVAKAAIRKFMAIHGYEFHALMGIGTGCQHHLIQGEIPMKGKLILSLSGHCAAVIDGVLYDSYDSRRGGNRCVYGYWRVPEDTMEHLRYKH